MRQARLEELKEFDKHNVLDVVPIQECWNVTGKSPVKVRRLDINKGDEKDKDYRSRLVAQELRKNNPELEIFAAMPPLEAKKLLFSRAVSCKHKSGNP